MQAFEFDKYEVVEELGRGAMGVVYRARERELDRDVALKMILADHLSEPHAVERFVAEARSAAQATHPGVVHIYDAGERNGQRFIAMEYIAGPNLAERLAEVRLGYDEAARVVSRIARAVQHLHEVGIVHRDLKPSNVMLADSGARPCVTDFGLAKGRAIEKDASEVSLVGTPGYMPPEQLGLEPAKPGPLGDVYSLGVVLYEAATGCRPFGDDSIQDVLLRSLKGRFHPPRAADPKLPRELEQVMLKALERSPAQRYPSAGALADDLDRFLAGEPVHADRGGPLADLARFSRRHVALVTRLCAFAAFFAVGCLNRALGYVDGAFLIQLAVSLGVWSVLCIVLERLTDRSWHWCRVWSLVDVAMVTQIMLMLDGASSSLVLIYPLLVVYVGLWSRARLVWFATLACALGYGVLIVDSELWHPARHAPADAHIVFVAVLFATALMTGVHIKRSAALRRLYAGGGRPAR